MGKAVFFKLLRCSGLPLLFREVVQRRRATILLFHDLSKETAAKAFDYLAAKYRLLDLQTFLRTCRAERQAAAQEPHRDLRRRVRRQL